MTRDEHRAKCIKALNEVLSLHGAHSLISPFLATELLDSLHNIAAVCPILSGDRDHLVLGDDLTNPPEKSDEHKK